MRRLLIVLVVLAASAAVVALYLREPDQPVSEERGEDGLDAGNSEDLEKLLSRAEEDAALAADHHAAKGEGGQTVRQMVQLLDRAFSEWKLRSARRFRMENEQPVIDEAVFAGSLKAPLELDVGARRVSARMLMLSWIDDGVATKIASYHNTPNSWLRQLGGVPPGLGGKALAPALPDSTEVVGGPSDSQRADMIRGALAAFGKGDRAALSRVFTEQTRFNDITENLVIKGLGALLKQLEPVERAFPGAVATVEHAYAVGDYAIVGLRWKATFSGKLGEIEPTGNEVQLRVGLVARFEGDHAVEVRSYWSRHMLDSIAWPDPRREAKEFDPTAYTPNRPKLEKVAVPAPVPPGSATGPDPLVKTRPVPVPVPVPAPAPAAKPTAPPAPASAPEPPAKTDPPATPGPPAGPKPQATEKPKAP